MLILSICGLETDRRDGMGGVQRGGAASLAVSTPNVTSINPGKNFR
jgi:hypothetical protein